MKNSKIKDFFIILVFILLLFASRVSIGGKKSIDIVENVVFNVLSPFQISFNYVSNVIGKLTYPIRNIFILADENESLKKEVNRLQQELMNARLTDKEYEDLKKLKVNLNYTKKRDIYNFVTADIISRDPSNWYDIFIVNVGIKDGVTKDSMVINENGLIGQIYEVFDKYSKVVTMASSKSAASFTMLDASKSFDGIVNGDVDGHFKGYFFDNNADVQIGDKIITSGLGIYPYGIMIGEIKNIYEDSNSFLKNIEVSSFVDFKNIGKVFIIPPINTIEEKVIYDE